MSRQIDWLTVRSRGLPVRFGAQLARPRGYTLVLESCLIAAVALLVAAAAAWSARPDPEERRLVLAEARAHLEENRADTAVEQLRPLANSRPLDPEVSLLYGRALLKNDQASLAMWPLQRVAERPGAEREAKILFVTALLQGGSRLEAIREATSLLDENPEIRGLRRLRALAHSLVLDHDSALADVEILLDSTPNDIRLHESRLGLLVELERHDEAREQIAEIDELLEDDRFTPTARATFCATSARAEYKWGDEESALARLQGCLESYPGHPDIVITRVEILDAAGRIEEASEELERAAESHPKRFRLQYALSKRLDAQGERGAAESVLMRTAEKLGDSRSWLALADLRVVHEDLKGATEAIDRGLRAETGRAPGEEGFSWSSIPRQNLFAFGDVFVRAQEFERVEEIIPILGGEDDVFAQLLRGRMQLERGEPAAALETYEQAFRVWPSNPAARYLAARAAAAIGEFDRAASYYQDSLRADASASDAGLVLARMQIAQGFAGAALETLRTYGRADPSDPHMLRLYAQAAILVGLYQEADVARASLASRVEWAGTALADQASDLARVVSLEEARRYLEASTELESASHFEALSAWVNVLAEMGEFETAAQRVELLRDGNPESAGYWVVWSRILARRGENEEAVEAARRATQLDSELVAAHRELGSALVAVGEVTGALASFDRAASIDPDDPQLEILAAEALLGEAGREGELRGRLERMLERHPWHGLAALYLARLEIEEEIESEAALRRARQAAYFNALSGPDSFEVLAQVLVAQGRAAEAVEELGRVARIGRATAGVHYQLALALIAEGDLEGARRELRASLQTPDFPQADAARDRLAELTDEQASSG